MFFNFSSLLSRVSLLIINEEYDEQWARNISCRERAGNRRIFYYWDIFTATRFPFSCFEPRSIRNDRVSAWILNDNIAKGSCVKLPTIDRYIELFVSLILISISINFFVPSYFPRGIPSNTFRLIWSLSSCTIYNVYLYTNMCVCVCVCCAVTFIDLRMPAKPCSKNVNFIVVRSTNSSVGLSWQQFRLEEANERLHLSFDPGSFLIDNWFTGRWLEETGPNYR